MKDDNGHVEQKNWTHVRQLLGYDRLEDPQLVEPSLSESLCVGHNLRGKRNDPEETEDTEEK
jgi:hypothetical protein